MSLNSITDVYAEQLGDLRSAETQLISALLKLAEATTDAELKAAFTHHLEETRGHLRRIEKIIDAASFAVPEEECAAMKGLISEGEKIIAEDAAPGVKDVALIAAAQRVEHYEIAAYGTARTLAKQLDDHDGQTLLDQTLDEESNADKLLLVDVEDRVRHGRMLRPLELSADRSRSAEQRWIVGSAPPRPSPVVSPRHSLPDASTFVSATTRSTTSPARSSFSRASISRLLGPLDSNGLPHRPATRDERSQGTPVGFGVIAPRGSTCRRSDP